MVGRSNLDVKTMVNNIGYIYSYSFKKFFAIDPEKYINVDDLMKDLYYKIPLWDSHASVSMKKSYSDLTEYIINSLGNGYIYISHNAKIDNIYRIYKELMSKNVKTITINITPFTDDDMDHVGIITMLAPIINCNISVKRTHKNDEQGATDIMEKRKYLYKYDIDEKILIYDILEKHYASNNVNTKINVPFRMEGIKFNIITQNFSIIETLFYPCENVTIYTYEDKGVPKQTSKKFSGTADRKIYLTYSIGFPYEIEGGKRSTTKIKSIGRKYYPMI
jgi:hypothetical protein